MAELNLYSHFEWLEVEKLKQTLERAEITTLLTIGTDERLTLSRQETISKIEEIVEGVIVKTTSGEVPTLVINNRNTWKNVQFRNGHGLGLVEDTSKTILRLDSPTTSKKFIVIFKVLRIIHELLVTNSFSTKRDIYYQDPSLFGNQRYVDTVIDDISCMLSVPRWHLNVSATSKGCVAGDLGFMEVDGNYVQCQSSATNQGVLIPSNVIGISSISSNARFILVVEKDATFQRLMDDGICERLHPMILITGKGMPDVNTRLFLKLLWEVLKIPVFVLVDADPHGIEILAIYKYGSKSLAFDSDRLTLPIVRWIGIWPSDFERLKIPEASLLPLTSRDKSKGRELLNRPYMAAEPAWKNEVQTVLKSGYKAEIQCLQHISATFLTHVYIPNKLKLGGWL